MCIRATMPFSLPVLLTLRANAQASVPRSKRRFPAVTSGRVTGAGHERVLARLRMQLRSAAEPAHRATLPFKGNTVMAHSPVSQHGWLPAAALLLLCVGAANGQGIPKFPLEPGPLVLSGPAGPHRFLNAVGERAGIWGFENGRLEAWVYPLKTFRDFHLVFQMDGSPELYRGDDIVRSVQIYPHMVQLRYAAEQFAVTETLFTPRQEPGILILLEVQAPAAMRIFARFRPQLDLMWPGGIGGQTSAWEPRSRSIRLAEATGRFEALIGSPNATSSSAVGYRPYLTDEDPYESLELRVTPEEAKRSFIPVIIAGGIRGAYDADAVYHRLAGTTAQLFREALRHYADLEERGPEIRTPDPAVNDAMRWASVALEQLKICNPKLGCSYVSGYGSSGTGTRPMYAWFFDEPVIAAWSELPLGQVEAVKLAYRFIRKYQREDGRVIHEVSQSAGYIDWFNNYPFAYIHPDSPLWYIVSLRHFYRFTGDREFLLESWDSIKKAYGACLKILDSSDGLLKIPPGEWGSMEAVSYGKDAAMAAEWIAALRALGDLSKSMGDEQLAKECRERERQAANSLEREFWDSKAGYYNYGVNLAGQPLTFHNPAIGFSAWFGSLPPDHAASVLERLSSAVMSADWGQRNMALDDPGYTEGSYQIGSVWPFFTSGTLLADYRYRNAIQGLLAWTGTIHLRELNARGSMPEALSGHAYRLLDCAVPHQMFSEHAVAPPLVYGILGLQPDVPSRTFRWSPQLPPSWPEVSVKRFPFGAARMDFYLTQALGELRAEVTSSSSEPISLEFAPALPAGSEVIAVLQDGKAVEFRTDDHPMDRQLHVEVRMRGRTALSIRYRAGLAAEVIWQPLVEGDGSRNLRVLRAAYGDHQFEMTVEGLPDHAYQVRLFTPWRPLLKPPATLVSSERDTHTVEFRAPEGALGKVDRAGYVRWSLSIGFAR